MYNEIFEPIILVDVEVNDVNTFTARVDMLDLPDKVRKSLGIDAKNYDAVVQVFGDFEMTLEDDGRKPSILVLDKNFVLSHNNVDVIISFTQFNIGELERDLVAGWDWQSEYDRLMDAAIWDAADRAWEES